MKTKQEIEAAIEARIKSGEPFTYMELCQLTPEGERHRDEDRIADRTIQKWRRKGWISFERVKGSKSPVWSLTPAGDLQAKGLWG